MLYRLQFYFLCVSLCWVFLCLFVLHSCHIVSYFSKLPYKRRGVASHITRFKITFVFLSEMSRTLSRILQLLSHRSFFYVCCHLFLLLVSVFPVLLFFAIYYCVSFDFSLQLFFYFSQSSYDFWAAVYYFCVYLIDYSITVHECSLRSVIYVTIFFWNLCLCIVSGKTKHFMHKNLNHAMIMIALFRSFHWLVTFYLSMQLFYILHISLPWSYLTLLIIIQLSIVDEQRFFCWLKWFIFK